MPYTARQLHYHQLDSYHQSHSLVSPAVKQILLSHLMSTTLEGGFSFAWKFLMRITKRMGYQGPILWSLYDHNLRLSSRRCTQGKFLVTYDSRIVNYNLSGLLRFAIGVESDCSSNFGVLHLNKGPVFYLHLIVTTWAPTGSKLTYSKPNQVSSS